jgi:hypothetical protein
MASVYQERRRLEAALRRELPNDYVIVSGPDHPLLLRAADLLVGGGGSLTAVFIPTAREKSDPDVLRARLTLNRLALQRDARPVLIAGPEAADLGGAMEGDFTQVIDTQHVQSLVRVIRGPVDTRRVVPKEVHLAASHRFGEAFRMSRVMAFLYARATRRTSGARQARAQAMFENISEPPEVEEGSKAEGKSSRTRIHRIDSSNFGGAPGVPIAAFSAGRYDSGQLTQLVYEQSTNLYSLDGGIPYPKRAPLGLALVSSWPLMARDPYKLVRALAFGGWSLALTDQVPRGSDRLQRIALRMRAAGEMES